MTPVEGGILIAMLKAAFPRTPMAEETAMVYLQLLADLPYSETRAAVAELIATSTWMPTIAEIRRAVWRRTEYLPEPEEAWAMVQEAIRGAKFDVMPGGVYVYHWPKHLPEPVQTAVRALGWRALVESDNLVADRAHFLRIYESVCRRRFESWTSEGIAAVAVPGTAQVSDRVVGLLDSSKG